MKKTFVQHVLQQLADILSFDVPAGTGLQEVYGGDINSTYIINTARGDFFVKVNRNSSTHMFEKEYNGLQLLRANSELQVPKPLAVGMFEGHSFLATECLERGSATTSTWQKLGAGLAAQHRRTQACFGLAEDNFIGSLAQPNALCGKWTEFYATQRILPLIAKAVETKRCTPADANSAEQLCAKLDSLFPYEPPALLHGDLWSGNFMACTNGNAAIYDPAVYYGNREMDIAMTLLFGGFDEAFYQHYNDVYPLQQEWRSRVALCQLYPLLVHLVLFGSSYYNHVKRILDSY